MNLEPRKRTALDGRVWWCVFDADTRKWSTLLCFGRYRRRKDAQYAIDLAKNRFAESL